MATEMVHGIDKGKLDEGAIDNALEKLDIKMAPRTGLAAKVKALQGEIAKREAAGAKMVDCENCGAPSTADDFEDCPFCGLGEEGSSDALPEPEDSSEESCEDADVPPADFAEEPLPEVEEGAAEPATDPLPPPPANPGSTPPPPSPVEGQVLVQKPKKEKKMKLAIVPPPMATVVDGQFETELDRVVAEIRRLHSMTAVSSWMLVKKIAETEDSGIWKTRLDGKGKPAHRDFLDFAAAELGFSKGYVKDSLKIVARYKEEEFKALGPTKLRLLVQITDPEKEKEALEALKKGASRRQIEHEYLGRKGSAPVDVAESRAKARAEREQKAERAPSERPKPKQDGKVTVALMDKKVRFPLFVKGKKGEEPKRAKRIGETPWGRLPIVVNDVEVLITITTNAKGELEAVAEPRRLNPAGK